MRVPEMLVALTVGVLLLLAGWRALARGAGAGRVLVEAGEVLETRRLGLSVLERELAGTRPGEDWGPHADGLDIRAYRGSGVVCAHPGPGAAVVDYQGMRQPDPLKDSLEVVRADGRRRVVGLTRAAAADAQDHQGCHAAIAPVTLEWDPPDQGGGATWEPVAPPALVRVFERGLYAVDDAFRYRRGRGGRQPLTAAVLDPASSWLGVRDGTPVLELSAGESEVWRRAWLR